jgi:hypothetical protein
LRRRSASAFAAAAVLTVVVAVSGATANERRLNDPNDTAGKLDIRIATAGHSADGRLRHVITTWDAWGMPDLAAPAGSPPSGFCVDIWTTRRPSAGPPDYLVCANPARDDSKLQAWVSRVSRRPGRTGQATEAAVSRPDGRTLILRFSQRQIGRPSRYYWRAETLYHGAECPGAAGCVDTAPEGQKVISHVLITPGTRTGEGGQAG